MKKNLLHIAFLVLAPYLIWANIHPDLNDSSRATTDGPYVFYVQGQIEVKQVANIDGKAEAVSTFYKANEKLTLTCTVESTGDKFAFPLHQQHTTPSHAYPQVEKLIALSDIEGNFKAMKHFLLSAGVIDKKFNWTYGNGHLVLNGDFFDRGLQVTECLWLLYKLDAQATAAGGSLHFILGNHEVMNLTGDVRYVRNKYLENAQLLGKTYKALYASDTELGRWLRSKNTIEKIGDIVFVHGGIEPSFAQKQLSFQEINDQARMQLDDLPAEFTRRSSAVAVTLEDRQHPIWCRSMAKSSLTESEINDIMTYLDAKHIVLGHTVTDDVQALYDGRVILIDQLHYENMRKGFMKSILVENGIIFTFCTKEGKVPMFTGAAIAKP